MPSTITRWNTTRRHRLGFIKFTRVSYQYIDVQFNGFCSDVINTIPGGSDESVVTTRDDFIREVNEYMQDDQNLVDQFENGRY